MCKKTSSFCLVVLAATGLAFAFPGYAQQPSDLAAPQYGARVGVFMDYDFGLPPDGNPTEEYWQNLFQRAKALREIGAEFASVHVSWAVVEPVEGQWDFSFYTRLFQTLVDAGLKILPVVGQSPHGDGVSVPTWYYEKYPDAPYINEFGRAPVNDSSQPIFPSLWHPETLPTFENYLRQVTRELLNPFQDDTIAYQVTFTGTYGEACYPGILPREEEWEGTSDFHEIEGSHFWCYDPYAEEHFRGATEEKYNSDLARLNAAWGTAYNDWDEIEPPLPETLPATAEGRKHWEDMLDWYRDTFRDFFGQALDLSRSILPSNVVIFIYSPGATFEILKEDRAKDPKWRRAILSRGGSIAVRQSMDQLWKMSQIEERWVRGERFGILVSSSLPDWVEVGQMLLGAVSMAEVYYERGYHFPLWAENALYWDVEYISHEENIKGTARFVEQQGYFGYRFFWDRYVFDAYDSSPNKRAAWLRETLETLTKPHLPHQHHY